MKEITTKEKVVQKIVAPDNEFQGYTIEEIRFQRALVAMEADFCKTKLLKSWHNLQKINPLSPSSNASLPGKVGSVAFKLFKGLNYMDYVLLGFSLFSGTRKFLSFFKGKKK